MRQDIELGLGSLKDSMKEFISPGDGIYKAQIPEEAQGMMTVGNLTVNESLKDNEVEHHTLNHGVYKAHMPIARFRNALDDERDEELETVTDEPDGDGSEFCVLAAVAGRGVVELLVDPVFQGWRRALRITGYLQGWRIKYCHKKHLIPDESCNICKLGEHRWDPRNEEKKEE